MKNVSSHRGIDTSSIRSRSIEFSLHFSSTTTGPVTFCLFTRLFTARSACIHLTGRNQPYKLLSSLSLSLKTLSCFPHFVHVSLLSLFSYLSIILFPSFVQIFVRSPLYRVIITYIVFEEAEMAPLSEDRLSDGEKSFIIGKWSIWDKQRSG